MFWVAREAPGTCALKADIDHLWIYMWALCCIKCAGGGRRTHSCPGVGTASWATDNISFHSLMVPFETFQSHGTGLRDIPSGMEGPCHVWVGFLLLATCTDVQMDGRRWILFSYYIVAGKHVSTDEEHGTTEVEEGVFYCAAWLRAFTYQKLSPDQGQVTEL